MSAPRVDMHRLQELVRLYRLGTGVRERARLLGMSTRTERVYREAIDARGLLAGPLDQLPEVAELCTAVAVAKPAPAPRVVSTSVDDWMGDIRTGVDRGVGAQAIWDKLRRDHPEFTGSLPAVKRAVARLRGAQGVKATDVAIPVVTGPGEEAQVDFGFAGWFLDPVTAIMQRGWIFVMVLAHSRHMFAKVVADQKATTWVALHREAFEFFGGVPHTIVPDNLKAAVVRAAFGAGDRHQLALNRTYREVARFFGFKIDPTPVGEPKKKGKAESGVKYAVRSYLRSGDFDTIAAANRGLPDWLLKTAGMRIHGTTGWRPLEAFAAERAALLPLPTTAYEVVEWRRATVHADSHVQFDRRLYSVPWPHIGSLVWVKATPESVMVYTDADERISTHPRRGTGLHSTNEAHLPAHRAALAQRSVELWVERADRLAPEVGTYVRHVRDSDAVLSKLRDIQAIVCLLERYPLRRAVRACRRAGFYGNYTYAGVRRILDEALDLAELPDELPGHVSLHGALPSPRFARTAPELTALSKEQSHECHQ